MIDRLPPGPASPAGRLQTLFARAVAVIVGTALLVGGFVISVAFFAVAFAVALGVLAVFLWKTRHLRRQMREQMREGMRQAAPPQAPPSGNVFEGTVIRSSDDEPRRD